jgi:hypothetical protein
MRIPCFQGRSMPRSALRLACVLLLGLFSACGDDPAEPRGVAGRYSVYTINGTRPPTGVFTGVGGTLEVVDASVRLDDGGAASVELTTRRVNAGVAGAEERTTYTGTFQVQGDVLRLSEMRFNGGAALAEGVVISPREVAVTLHLGVANYTGVWQYPVTIIARR